jgi:transposase
MTEKEKKKTLKIWFGADVSKDSFDVSISMTGEGIKEISSMPKVSFARTEEGVEEFRHWVEEQIARNFLPEKSEFGVVMEATGSYSLTLVSWLIDKCPGCVPSIADPKSVHAYGKSLRIRNKTDKTDAAILAMYGAERNPSAYVSQRKEYS